MRYLIVVALLALPIDAHAKGDDETSPPKTTKTTNQETLRAPHAVGT